MNNTKKKKNARHKKRMWVRGIMNKMQTIKT
jgi:hypothetical protein